MAHLLGRGAPLLAAGGLALVLAASPALAVVSATTEGSAVIVESDEATDVVTMSCVGDEASVNDDPALPALACGAVTRVLVDAEDGAHTVNLGGVTHLAFPQLTRTSVDVDDSAFDPDSVTGSEARDVVQADFADDVSTGLGADWVDGAGTASGGDGNDTLREIAVSVRGGPGDDLIVGAPAELIDGGGGFDTVVIDYSSFTSPPPVALTITDTSINGVTATAGVEVYDVTAADFNRQDRVNSASYSGRVSFHGRDGNDIFVGGPGADVADGGLGIDDLNPGPGSDLVLGGDGDDTISARDGFGDVVECGPGVDTVTADRIDTLSGCENVALPAPETSRIDGPKKVRVGTKATFLFAASVASATFECQRDAGAFIPCASPFKLRTRKLKVGRHTLHVRAVQPAGNADPTPSSFTFKVKPKPKRKPGAHA